MTPEQVYKFLQMSKGKTLIFKIRESMIIALSCAADLPACVIPWNKFY